MKLSKAEIKLHTQCGELLKQDHLTYEEKCFVYQNFYPAYHANIGEIASFFTPFTLAEEFTIDVCGSRIIDLCAGIGMLGFIYFHQAKKQGISVEVVCIERNQDFVNTGMKLFPEARWICDDVLDQNLYNDLGRFDCVISNPPYGKIKSTTDTSWLKYRGTEFEYKVIDIASQISDYGAFIIPRTSTSFKMTNSGFETTNKMKKVEKFEKETGMVLEAGTGVNCDLWVDQWKGTKVFVEIALMML